MSPDGGVLYDLAWTTPAGLVLAEVKSLTDANEVAQLRSGIGQLVDYASELEARSEVVVGLVLVVERRPADVERWRRACGRVGLQLTWAPDFPGLF
jgi:hypothetical protein